MEKMFVTADDLVKIGLLKSRGSATEAERRGELPPSTRVGQRHVWRYTDVLAHFEARKGEKHFVNGLSSDRRTRRVVRRA